MSIVRRSFVLKYVPVLAAVMLAGHLVAQVGVSTSESTSAPVVVADATLPDAPQPQAALAVAVLPQPDGYKSVNRAPVASLYTKYIPAGETAQPITARDKVVIGLKDLVNPLNFLGMFASAGYEQALNGSPNYGTDRGAFGERLGAAALRTSSQGIFTDSVFSPLLHEDPRYYVQGPGHSFVHRTVYSVTRPFISRTDSGKSTVNGALLLGYASAAALSYTYYPKINQNFHDTASTFGGSIGGAALGYFVSEFSNDFLQAMHLKKKS